MTLTSDDTSNVWLIGTPHHNAASTSSSPIFDHGEPSNAYPSTSYGGHHHQMSMSTSYGGNHLAASFASSPSNHAIEPSMNPNYLRQNNTGYNTFSHAHAPTLTGSLHPGNVMLHHTGTSGTSSKSAMAEIQRLLAQQQQGQAGVRSLSHEEHFGPASLALYNSQQMTAEHLALRSPLHAAGMQPMPSASWPSSSRLANDLHSSPQFDHYHSNVLTPGHDGLPTLANMPLLSATATAASAHHMHGSPLSSSMSMLTDSASNSPYLSSNLAMMSNHANTFKHASNGSLISPMAFQHAAGGHRNAMGIVDAEGTPPITTASLASRTAPPPPSATMRISTIGGSIAGSTRRTKFRRSRTGCMVCRKRKVRCDQDGVPCKQCRIGKRECHYEDSPPKRKRKAKSVARHRSTDDGDTVKPDSAIARDSSCDPIDGSENNSGDEEEGEEEARASTSSSRQAHSQHEPSLVPRPVSTIATPLTTAFDVGGGSEQWAAGMTNLGLFSTTDSDEWAITTPSTGPTSVHTADGDGLDSSSSSRRVTLTFDGHADVKGALHKSTTSGLDEGSKKLAGDLDISANARDSGPASTNEDLTTNASLLDASRYAVHPHSS